MSDPCSTVSSVQLRYTSAPGTCEVPAASCRNMQVHPNAMEPSRVERIPSAISTSLLPPPPGIANDRKRERSAYHKAIHTTSSTPGPFLLYPHRWSAFGFGGGRWPWAVRKRASCSCGLWRRLREELAVEVAVEHWGEADAEHEEHKRHKEEACITERTPIASADS